MSVLSPFFLVGAAAAAIPIVLHLLRREPEIRVKFALVHFLRRAPVEHTERRHLRELLLLALRVAALVLLAIAFARPFFAAGVAAGPSGVTIVALDTSLSLSAPGQFARARQLASDAISRAAASDAVGVVTFAEDASVGAAASGDRSLALSAIDAATPGYGAARYRAALTRAAEMLGGLRGTIVIVTDLQENGWDASDRALVPDSARIEIADVGALPPNLAITSVRSANNRIIATVRNAGPQPREANVRLTVDDRPSGQGTITIAPNQSADVLLPGARGSAASVAVDDPAGISADNTRYLVLDNLNRPTVLLVTATGDVSREAFYAQHALTAAGADGAAYDVAGVSAADLAVWDRAKLARHAAIVMMSTRGLERHGRELIVEYVKQGGGLLIAAGPDVDGEVVSETTGGAMTIAQVQPARGRPAPRSFAPADIRHPLFQAFGAGVSSLGLITFTRIASVSGKDVQMLARFTTGETALAECELGTGRALAFASDLDNLWNDFPRHATFVPFLQEAIRYVSGGRVRGGEYLVGDAPEGLPARPGLAALPAPPGETPRRVAINVDPAESDPGRLTPAEFQAAVTRLQDEARSEGRIEDRQQEERQHLWQYLLGLMLAMMLVESLVAAKTA